MHSIVYHRKVLHVQSTHIRLRAPLSTGRVSSGLSSARSLAAAPVLGDDLEKGQRPTFWWWCVAADDDEPFCGPLERAPSARSDGGEGGW